MLVRSESVLAPTDARSKRTDEPTESVYGVEGVSAVIRVCVGIDERRSSKGMFQGGGRGGLSWLGGWCHQHRKRAPLDCLDCGSLITSNCDQTYTSRGRVSVVCCPHRHGTTHVWVG